MVTLVVWMTWRIDQQQLQWPWPLRELCGVRHAECLHSRSSPPAIGTLVIAMDPLGPLVLWSCLLAHAHARSMEQELALVLSLSMATPSP